MQSATNITYNFSSTNVMAVTSRRQFLQGNLSDWTLLDPDENVTGYPW